MTAMVLTVSWLLIVVAHLKFRRTRSKLNSLMFPVPWTAWSNYLIIVFVIAILAILAADHTLRSALILTGFSFTGLFITATLRVRRLFDEVHC